MATKLLGAMTTVPRHAVDVERIQRELYIPNKAYDLKVKLGKKLSKNDYPGVELWIDDGDFIHVPRGYPIPSRECLMIESVLPDVPRVEMPPFRMRLRPNQEVPAQVLYEHMYQDKLLCLGCGKGKTILSLHHAYWKRTKTLILVDRDFLVSQWRKEIKKCFWLTSDKIGIIQGKKFDVGEQFTIAVIHTLSKRELTAEFCDQFGLIIVDECHMLGAPTFSTVLPLFPGERLGLSATPDRADGMDPVFRYHLGGMEPVYVDVSREKRARWIFKALPRLIDPDVEARCYQWTPMKNRSGENIYVLNRPTFDTKVCASGRWQEIIVRDLIDANKAGRHVLVLGDRVEHLFNVQQALQVLGVDAGFVDSSVKGMLRDQQFKKKVILATWKIASRALDIPELDTLFLLFPNDNEGFLRQAVGRMDRDHDGKNDIMVVTYSHVYNDTMEKKEGKMIGVLRNLDKDAKVELIGPRSARNNNDRRVSQRDRMDRLRRVGGKRRSVHRYP